MTPSPHYLVGIDLGTTHCVVAYCEKAAMGEQAIQLFPIPQLIAPGQVASRLSLPSFRYHPASERHSAQDLALPWEHQPIEGDIPQIVIGEWAREIGTQEVERSVNSAKSWLSYDKVDREQPILPWIANNELPKVSPVVASASYLNHIKLAWNHAHPINKLEFQHIAITIPASFDEAARNFTLQAAKLAGLSNIKLVEEPQAACYDWYQKHQQQAEHVLDGHSHLLVVDVGGGTTDLSLLSTHTASGEFQLQRTGVGEHLMLGGDNIDLAIAHYAEHSINKDSINKGKLNASNLTKLVQQARHCKETLLQDDAPQQAKLTLLGGGSRLIGGAKSIDMPKQMVHQIALEGFMPFSNFEELPTTKRGAVVEFGLPYASDPAISKHIAQFLANHQSQLKGEVPSAVLLNGGLFNSPLMVNRITDLLSMWHGKPITLLNNLNPNHAVALGAVSFLKAQLGALKVIKSAAARSYFLHLPSKKGPGRALCLLKKGVDVGSEIHISGRHFHLTLNKPAKFHVLTTTQDIQISGNPLEHGQIIDVVNQPLLPLPPLVTTLKQHQEAQVKVTLASQLTDVGTVKIDALSQDNHTRWTLEFDTRNLAEKQTQHPHLKEAQELIQAAYSAKAKRTTPSTQAKGLIRRVEKQLGAKEQWDLATSRALFDTLLLGRKRRRRSQEHEASWLRLAGFCLRPGFGDKSDEWRCDQIWGLLSQSIQFESVQGWNDWWTMWRRIAGGLNQAQQEALLTQVVSYIHPGAFRSKQDKEKAHQHGYEAMVKLAASLEKLEVEDKHLLGNWFLNRALNAHDFSATHWWAVARIGSRLSLQQSQHQLLPREVIEPWIETALQSESNNDKNLTFCLAMLSRRVDDRLLSIRDDLRTIVVNRLNQDKVPTTWLRLVSESSAMDSQLQKQVLGDSLPSGLQLIENS